MYYQVYKPSNYVIHYYILSLHPNVYTTLKIVYYTFIEFIIYALHIVKVCQIGVQTTHSPALLLSYATISCKETNHLKNI